MDEKRRIATIKKIMPAVVSIIITRHLEDIEKEIPVDVYPAIPGGKKKNAPQDIPAEIVDGNGMVQVGGGSGFFSSSDGVIVTNKHVISDAKASYTVVTTAGQKLAATVISRDPVNDVAILKVQGKNFPTIELGDAAHLELGQTVLAVGNALGVFRNTVSVGIISGLSRSIMAQADPDAPVQELRGLIQTDAAINPGNSGGPLVDGGGKAIGINAAIISGAQNIGLAIPINAARRDLDDLKKYGRIRRPYLGLRYLILDDRLKEKMKIAVDYGAYVMRDGAHSKAVIENSPAARAGMKEKDIILACNDKKITTDYTIQDALDDLKVGDVFHVRFLRAGREHQAKIILSERF